MGQNLKKVGYTKNKWVTQGKWVTLKKWITLEKKLTLQKSLTLGKKPPLENWLTPRKITKNSENWVTFKKIGHTWQHGSHTKKGSHLEKWVTR